MNAASWDDFDELVAADPQARYGNTWLSVSRIVRPVARPMLRPVRSARRYVARRRAVRTAGRSPDDPSPQARFAPGQSEADVAVAAIGGAS